MAVFFSNQHRSHARNCCSFYRNPFNRFRSTTSYRFQRHQLPTVFDTRATSALMCFNSPHSSYKRFTEPILQRIVLLGRWQAERNHVNYEEESTVH